jgi:hypothetical protein
MDSLNFAFIGASSASRPEWSAEPEDWVLRLRAAYEAGYYRTEAAAGEQTRFPWQGKTCKDCPFWSHAICFVHNEQRSSAAHTCTYFDAPNRDGAREIIASRVQHQIRAWWGQ